MSLAATLVQNSRVRAEFDKYEMMIEQAGIWDTFRRQTESAGSIINSAIRDAAFRSIGREVKVPVFNFKDVTIRSTRPIVVPADENTSAFVQIVWHTLAYNIKMYPAQYVNNDIGYQEDFDWKFKAMMRKLIKTLEGLGATALDVAKNQVQPELVGSTSWSSDILHETGTTTLKNAYIIHDIVPAMASLDFNDMGMDIVGNQSLRAVLARMEGYGTFNEENKTLPFAGKNFHWSNQITNAAGINATGYAIADGSIGRLMRVEADSLLGTSIPDGHSWGTVNLPMIGTSGVYEYTAVVDATSVAPGATDHLSRTTEENMDFNFDVALVTPYISDPANIATPILKFDIDTD